VRYLFKLVRGKYYKKKYGNGGNGEIKAAKRELMRARKAEQVSKIKEQAREARREAFKRSTTGRALKGAGGVAKKVIFGKPRSERIKEFKERTELAKAKTSFQKAKTGGMKKPMARRKSSGAASIISGFLDTSPPKKARAMPRKRRVKRRAVSPQVVVVQQQPARKKRKRSMRKRNGEFDALFGGSF